MDINLNGSRIQFYTMQGESCVLKLLKSVMDCIVVNLTATIRGTECLMLSCIEIAFNSPLRAFLPNEANNHAETRLNTPISCQVRRRILNRILHSPYTRFKDVLQKQQNTLLS